MATNQTTNYQLNQWEPADQVLRTDFNADNAKLDAALLALDASKLGHIEILSTAVNSAGGKTTFSVDVSTLDWDEFEYVVVFFDNTSTINTGASEMFACALNDEPDNAYCSYASKYIAVAEPGSLLLILFPRHSGANLVRGVYLGEISGIGLGSIAYNTLTTLDFSVYGGNRLLIRQGAKATVWGIR